jgi:hypothetical protein
MRGFGGWPAVDFAAAGLRMRARDVATAGAQWRAFAADVPAYPTGTNGDTLFAGRGIVIIGCACACARKQRILFIKLTNAFCLTFTPFLLFYIKHRGGLQYMVPAWVALSALRRAGCALPAEVWFNAHEMPDKGAPCLCCAVRHACVLA